MLLLAVPSAMIAASGLAAQRGPESLPGGSRTHAAGRGSAVPVPDAGPRRQRAGPPIPARPRSRSAALRAPTPNPSESRGMATCLTPEALVGIPQVLAPSVSPSGLRFAFIVDEVDAESGKKRRTLFEGRTDGTLPPGPVLRGAPGESIGRCDRILSPTRPQAGPAAARPGTQPRPSARISTPRRFPFPRASQPRVLQR